MYDIFTHIWLIFMVNVGKYTIHGSYGHPFSENGHVLDDFCLFFFPPRQSRIFWKCVWILEHLDLDTLDTSAFRKVDELERVGYKRTLEWLQYQICIDCMDMIWYIYIYIGTFIYWMHPLKQVVYACGRVKFDRWFGVPSFHDDRTVG